MRVASGPSSSFTQEPSPGRRAVSFVFALLANILILFLLLTLAPEVTKRPPPGGSTAITFSLPDAQKAAATRAKSAARAHSTAREVAPPIPKPPVTPPPTELTGLLPLTHEEIAAADISKLPSHADERAAGGGSQEGSGTEGSSDSTYTQGPGGEKLYNVEWYREPTDAELSAYIHHNAPSGAWADIMCQTIERFHVDNCRELADSPPGSQLARSMRQAAWQFLVRPPRIGGRSIIGTWVRIHVSFSDKPER